MAERSSLESPANINYALYKAKSRALYRSLLNNWLNYRFIQAIVVAATNYKIGDTKI
jgi:hypothetical protein